MKELHEVKVTGTDAAGDPIATVERWNGTIWYLQDDESGGEDGEFFDTRPQTPGVGGELDNWPDEYTLRVGNLNGGDSLVIERRNSVGEVWVRSDEDYKFWRMEIKG